MANFFFPLSFGCHFQSHIYATTFFVVFVKVLVWSGLGLLTALSAVLIDCRGSQTFSLLSPLSIWEKKYTFDEVPEYDEYLFKIFRQINGGFIVEDVNHFYNRFNEQIAERQKNFHTTLKCFGFLRFSHDTFTKTSLVNWTTKFIAFRRPCGSHSWFISQSCY